MNLVMFLFLAVLAFALSPGVLISLPPNSSKTVTALTHSLVLALVYALVHKTVYRMVAK
jgi:hypothetical protein